MTKNELKRIQLAAFEARKAARDAFDRLSILQREAKGAAFADWQKMQDKAESLTLRAKMAKRQYRAGGAA